MGSARVTLFLSPLLVFVKYLVPEGDYFSLIVVATCCGLMMAAICSLYAAALGRSPMEWAFASFFLPFLAPFVLAFVPPMPGSQAAIDKMLGGGKYPAARGKFRDRYPLLERLLATESQETTKEQRERYFPFRSNYQFIMVADYLSLERFETEAKERKFELYKPEAAGGSIVFGAGLVGPDEHEEIRKWLISAAVSGSRLTIAWHPTPNAVEFAELHTN